MFTLEDWNRKTKKGISVSETRTETDIKKVYIIKGWYKTESFASPDDIKKIKKLIKEAENINKRTFANLPELKKEAAIYNIELDELLKDKLLAIDSYVAYYMIDYAEENYHELLSNCAI